MKNPKPSSLKGGSEQLVILFPRVPSQTPQLPSNIPHIPLLRAMRALLKGPAGVMVIMNHNHTL